MEIELKQFKGPLDLLLNLIQKQELDLSEISLATVADQYLKYIKENRIMNPEELIYFIDIASQLILLKTRLLDPYLDSTDDDLDDETNLIEKLQIYQEYLAAAKKLELVWNNDPWECLSVKAGKSKITNKSSIINAKKLSSSILESTMIKLLKNLAPPKLSIKLKRRLNIQAKIELIIDYLKQKRNFVFNELLPERPTKTDIIVNFIALLELSKKRTLHLSQPIHFESIDITKVIIQA